MKEWLQNLISSDQSLANLVIGYILLCLIVFISIGLFWFLLYLLLKCILNCYEWIYTKRKDYEENTLNKLLSIKYFIEDTYHKFNVFEIKSNFKERLSSKGLIKFRLFIGVFWGIIAMILAFVFVYSIAGNPYNEYRLLKSGTSTEGYITDVNEEFEERDAGGYTYYYYYTFIFKLPNGKTITGYQELSGSSPQKTPDVSEPYPIEIVYLKTNPEINKLKATLCDNLWEIVWRKIGLGLLLLIISSSIGFSLVRKSIKEYLTERKKLT